MVKIQIRAPIWKTPRSVGLAASKLNGHKRCRVSILYKTKDGERLYPGFYEMDCFEILSYRTQMIKGVRLHVVPIVQFKSSAATKPKKTRKRNPWKKMYEPATGQESF